MTLRLGGDGAITGCTSLEEPTISISGLTMTTPIEAVSGTAAAPSYTFSGDTDNGLYYAGTNSIGLSTAGSNAILIDSAGNVIVGGTTTSSTNAAYISQNGVYVSNRTAGTNDLWNGKLNGTVTSTINADGSIVTSAGASFDGNVGIGTASPSTQLHVVETGAFSAITASSNVATTGLASRFALGNSVSTARFTINMKGGGGEEAYLGSEGNFPIYFQTHGAERMRIDSNGNVGIGTSSPNDYTSANYQALTLNGTQGGIIDFESNGTHVGQIFNTASEFTIGSQGTIPFNLRSNGLNRLTVDSAGDVTLQKDLYFADAAGSFITAVTPGVAYRDLTIQGSLIKFGVGSGSATERMRFTTNGLMKVSSSGTYSTSVSTGLNHEIRNDNSGWDTIYISSQNANPYGIQINLGTTKNNSTNYFLYCGDNTKRLQINSNGGIQNYQGNDYNLCDEREKKNIVDLGSKWDKVKSWELKKFHYNEDANTDNLRYGVIAQQVETVCPEVLADWQKQKATDAVLDEDGNVVEPAKEEVLRKGVKEQQMMWMAIKALQEAQERIEQLETKVAALET